MFYFDIRPCLKRMTREQQGELFCAILDYGEFGTEPEFSDPAIYFAWDFIKPRLDNDDKAYKNKCEKAKEAVEKRWEQEKKDDADECERILANTAEYDRNIPIPTSSSTSSPPSKANNIPPTPQGERKPRRKKYDVPTLDDVIKYATSRGRKDLAQGFFEYYNEGNWCDSKGNPVLSWKQKFITWEQRNPKPKENTSGGEKIYF